MRLVSLLLLVPGIALAVPTEITHQGRLFDGLAQPLDGTHTLAFALYDTPSGGSAAWTESQAVEFDDGYFSARLGSSSPLDSDDLTGDVMYLELTVDSGAPFPGRVPVTSVPYALRAGSVSGGTVDATELQINGTTVIDSSGTLDISALPAGSDSDTLGELACSDGDVAQLQSGSWACAALTVAAHTHDASDITGVLAVAQIPVGTGSSQVAAGDHSHTAADVGALPIAGGALTGALSIGDTSAGCTNGNNGQIRYGSGGLEICMRGTWTGVSLDRAGHSRANPAADCQDVLASDGSAPSGIYWLDPGNTGAPFQAACDMVTNGGGWTRLVPEFKSYSWRSANCGGSPDSDCMPGPGSVNSQYPHRYFKPNQAGVVTYNDANGIGISDAQLAALAGRISAITATNEVWLYDPDAANPWPIEFFYADGSSNVVTPPGQFCDNCWRDDTATYASHVADVRILTGLQAQQNNLGVFVHFLEGEVWVR